MKDHSVAAMQRCQQLVETLVHEIEGIYENERTVQSSRLLVSARVFAGALEIFAEWAKLDSTPRRKTGPK